MSNSKNRLKRIISVAAAKGGCGKSSLVNALANYIPRVNKKYQVLLIDADPQGSTTSLYRLSKQQKNDSELYKAFYAYDNSGELPSNFKPARINNNISLITSSPRLETVPTLMKDNASIANLVMLQMIMDLPDDYDYICIDNAPAATGLLAINSFICSDVIVSPTDPGIFDIHSMKIMKNKVSELKNKMKDPRDLHKSLIKAKLVFVADRVKQNTKSSKIFENFVKSNPALFKATFRERELVNRANMAGTSIFKIASNSSDRKIVNHEIEPNLHKLYHFIVNN